MHRVMECLLDQASPLGIALGYGSPIGHQARIVRRPFVYSVKLQKIYTFRNTNGMSQYPAFVSWRFLRC